ncbi:hypothetical protein ABD87_23015 [Lysinibacillus sphaericus]|uniref:hypothetical protein n=1 Tax=Lysinibacillus sphaericus TaxID=1421 RepID=UPI0018CE0978|nr:hypothetical protein [Lysinibacillus sphaericus]MBG9732298.1 hypothetical protein [Lysinibacillus sphaericus]
MSNNNEERLSKSETINRYFSEIDLSVEVNFKDNKTKQSTLKTHDEVIVRSYTNGLIYYTLEHVHGIEKEENRKNGLLITTTSGSFDEYGTWIENRQGGMFELTQSLEDNEELTYEDTKVLLPLNEQTLLGCGWTVLKNRLQSFLQGDHYNDYRYSNEHEQNFYNQYKIGDLPQAYIVLLGNLLKPYIHNKNKNFILESNDKKEIIDLFSEVQYNEINIMTLENVVRTIEEAFRSLYSNENLAENQGKRKKGKVTKESMDDAQPSYVDKIKREVNFMLYTKKFKVFQHSNLQPLSLTLIEYLHEYGFEQVTIEEHFNRVYSRKEQGYIIESSYSEIWNKGVHELQFVSNSEGELVHIVHQSSRKTYTDKEINLKLRIIQVDELQEYIKNNFKPLKTAYREQPKTQENIYTNSP